MQQPAAGGEDLDGLWHLPRIWCPSVGVTNQVPSKGCRRMQLSVNTCISSDYVLDSRTSHHIRYLREPLCVLAWGAGWFEILSVECHDVRGWWPNPSTMGVGGIPRNQRHQRLPGGHRIGPRGCCVDHAAKTPENGEHSEGVLLPLVFTFCNTLQIPGYPNPKELVPATGKDALLSRREPVLRTRLIWPASLVTNYI